MGTAPDLEDLQDYLSDGADWSSDQIEQVLAVERAAQQAVCRVPVDVDAFPDDLAEALRRRVAHTLALRPLPLGFQADLGDGGVTVTRVGGTDSEVRRLEAPYRKLVVG